MLQGLIDDFQLCFVKNGRWEYLLSGLGVTLEVALAAIVLGLAVGFLVAVVRSTHDKYGHFPVLNFAAKAYLTIIRGTPMVVQLLITYYIILRSVDSKVLIAILAFGINSGAYQAEIIRAGIVSIDPGQMEAGRALGLSYWRTMLRVILPQAVRNVLPALGNEFIVLMKDTSIVGYIALIDLAKGGDIIRSQTYSVYLPYLTVAAIYLALVMTFTWILGKVERYLRSTGAEDATIVATHMILAAADAGVDSCWLNNFDPDKLAALLHLPENEEIVMALDLGYAAEGAGPLPNHFKRKDLTETVSYL